MTCSVVSWALAPPAVFRISPQNAHFGRFFGTVGKVGFCDQFVTMRGAEPYKLVQTGGEGRGAQLVSAKWFR